MIVSRRDGAARPGKLALGIVLPLAAIVAGCGGMSLPANSDPSGLTIHPAKTVVDTNTADQLQARLASGAPVAVNWSISGGDNNPSLGQGSIDSTGLYTPPPLLSQDTASIEIRASSVHDPSLTATYRLAVTPGFVQSLNPENASLAAGGTVDVTGQLAEVNAGAISWRLAANASGEGDLGPEYGALSDLTCHHSPRSYTFCTARYTAPPTLPGKNASLYVIGSASVNPQSSTALRVLLNEGGFNSSALENQVAQTGTVEMGSSGGNANDYDSSQDSKGNQYVDDCCGGTLGALVADKNSNLFILSNNHVLSESDQAKPGDAIVQPALIDLNCNPQAGRTVGSLSYIVPIDSTQTNVDAALANASPAVDPSGGILKLGSPIHGVLSTAAPAGGLGENLTASVLDQLQVVKSGRTTGLTCSSVNTVDLSVQVDYYYDCAEKRPYLTKTYTGQMGIPGASFADSGDSGALVLDASNAQPLGLLFASGAGTGNTGFSVANPIQDVLSELGEKSQTAGEEFRIVGGAPHPVTCSNYDQSAQSAPVRLLSPAESSEARAAADSAAALVRPEMGILGLDVGRSLDAPDEPAVIVYVSNNKPGIRLPKTIGGLRTVAVSTDAASVASGTAPQEPQQIEGIHLSGDILRTASAVVRQYAPVLMRDPAIFGVGVTESYDNPAEAALLVLVDLARNPEATPPVVGGLRVRYLKINRLHVTRSKFASAPRPSSCELPK